MTGESPSELRLTDELRAWEVRLLDGATLRVHAHAYSLESDAYVFVALFEGSPCFEREVARIPERSVAQVRSV